MSAKLLEIAKLNRIRLPRQLRLKAANVCWLISGCFVYVYETLRPQPASVSVAGKLWGTPPAPAPPLLLLTWLCCPRARGKANCRAPFNKHSVNLLHLAGSHTAMSSHMAAHGFGSLYVCVCVCYVSGLPPLLVLIFLHFPLWRPCAGAHPWRPLLVLIVVLLLLWPCFLLFHLAALLTPLPLPFPYLLPGSLFCFYYVVRCL